LSCIRDIVTYLPRFKRGHVTPNTFHSALIYHARANLVSVSVHNKFEVPTFTHSRDMIGPQKFKISHIRD